MTTLDDIGTIAEAEKILNRTLAYQAAIAVHELKDRLKLDVGELRLVVAPINEENVGSYRVTCTIAGLAIKRPVLVDLIVRPDQIVAPGGNGEAAATGK